MVNNLENNNSLDSVSDLENSKNKVEMMRYRPNSLSYMLGFLAILCSVMGAFVALNSMAVNKPLVLVKILLNIAILLVGFLCCEKSKAYSMQGSIALIVLGAICALRIFWVPLNLMRGVQTGAVVTPSEYAIAWLPNSGVFRGVFATVFMAAAAALFIVSGVIGYMRSKKLSTYMDSIKEKL